MNNPKQKTIFFVILAVVIVIFIFVLSPVYTLLESDMAVITMFGNPKRSVVSAGLHFKLPFMEKVTKLPKKVLAWDGEVKQFPTYDKRMVLVDTTVRWTIKDPILFYKRLGTVKHAMSRLDDILDSASRKVVSKHFFEEITRSTDRITDLSPDTIELLQNQGVTMEDLKNFPHIRVGRKTLSEKMKEIVIPICSNMGINVVEFYIKKVNYIKDNLESVYQNMIAEREKIAESYRANGISYKKEKLGEIEKQKQQIIAHGQGESRTIRGEGDAEATRIYNTAYNRNASTREFYEFIKKMEVYADMPSNTSLIISTDSDFFNMLKSYK